jgi:predicted alternative tryptophan synthase beta-subunit
VAGVVLYVMGSRVGAAADVVVGCLGGGGWLGGFDRPAVAEISPPVDRL